MNFRSKIAIGGILFFIILLLINLIFKILPVATNKTLLILSFAMSYSTIIAFFIDKKASKK